MVNINDKGNFYPIKVRSSTTVKTYWFLNIYYENKPIYPCYLKTLLPHEKSF